MAKELTKDEREELEKRLGPNEGGSIVMYRDHVAALLATANRAALFEGTPKGFRDLYWCWIINEPEFVYGPGTDPDGKKICAGCECDIVGLEDRHTFIAHIMKPTE